MLRTLFIALFLLGLVVSGPGCLLVFGPPRLLFKVAKQIQCICISSSSLATLITFAAFVGFRSPEGIRSLRQLVRLKWYKRQNSSVLGSLTEFRVWHSANSLAAKGGLEAMNGSHRVPSDEFIGDP